MYITEFLYYAHLVPVHGIWNLYRATVYPWYITSIYHISLYTLQVVPLIFTLVIVYQLRVDKKGGRVSNCV